MKVLLDTHILIWSLAEPAKLSENWRLALEDPQNEILFSAASIWEIALKKRIGRINFAFAPDQIAKAARESGFAELPVFAIAAALVEQLAKDVGPWLWLVPMTDQSKLLPSGDTENSSLQLVEIVVCGFER